MSLNPIKTVYLYFISEYGINSIKPIIDTITFNHPKLIKKIHYKTIKNYKSLKKELFNLDKSCIIVLSAVKVNEKNSDKLNLIEVATRIKNDIEIESKFLFALSPMEYAEELKSGEIESQGHSSFMVGEGALRISEIIVESIKSFGIPS